MEWVIQIVALLLCVLLALIKTMRFAPSGLSEFELRRRATAGEKEAIAEEHRRMILPTCIAVRDVKELVLTILLLWLLFATHDVWVGLLLSAAYLFAAHVIFAKGWLAQFAKRLQRMVEDFVNKHAKVFIPALGWLATVRGMEDEALGIASRDELRAVIANDSQLLAPDDKSRLLGAFDFGSLLVADAMVPRDKIITVDSKETVGPVLLDRLHKDKHNIYVVVKKNLDHIQGLLYMHDLTPIDPDIKEVADATRPTVHYLHANAPLQDVLSASLASGRQLFVVTDDDGKTKGLITLADALRFLNGEPLPKISPRTKPE